MLVAAELVAKSGEAAKSGPLGFAVILVLCIACYFLFRSMSRHLRKVREHPPEEQPPPYRPHESPPAKRAQPVPRAKDEHEQPPAE